MFTYPIHGAQLAASAVSFETVTASLVVTTGFTATVNLTKGQDETQCVPFVTCRYPTLAAATDQTDLGKVNVEMIDNGGTPAVRVTRSGAANALELFIYVMEFNSDISVQQITWGTETGTTWTAACTAVDTSKTFIVPTSQCISTGVDDDIWAADYRVKFNSSTELGFLRVDTGVSLAGTVYLVEDTTTNYWDVQHITANKNLVAAADVTIPSTVALPSSFLISTSSNNYGSSPLKDGGWDAYIFDGDTIKVLSGTATHDHDFAFQVVTFLDNTLVQHGRDTVVVPGAANNDNVQEIALGTTIDETRTMAIPTKVGYQTGIVAQCTVEGAGAYSGGRFQMKIKAGGTHIQLRSNTQPASSTFIVPWQAIQWDM